jgi:ankyrin repeat protein
MVKQLTCVIDERTQTEHKNEIEKYENLIQSEFNLRCQNKIDFQLKEFELGVLIRSLEDKLRYFELENDQLVKEIDILKVRIYGGKNEKDEGKKPTEKLTKEPEEPEEQLATRAAEKRETTKSEESLFQRVARRQQLIKRQSYDRSQSELTTGEHAVVTQFKPVKYQWELNDENIKRIDPKTGETILHNYCKYINTTPLEVFKYLIEIKGCLINVKDKNGNPPPYYALHLFKPNSDVNTLFYLLSQNGLGPKTKGKNDDSLLHQACLRINTLPLAVFEYLLDVKRCDLNAIDNTSRSSPLYHAINAFTPKSGGDINTLIYLLTRKELNLMQTESGAGTLLHLACTRVNVIPIEIFKTIHKIHPAACNLKDGVKNYPICYVLSTFRALSGGDIDTVMYLLGQKGLEINTKGHEGLTPLHLACRNINSLPLGVFKYLIETLGADINAIDDRLETPLHYGIIQYDRCGDINNLYYLLNLPQLNIDAKDGKGVTIFHFAAFNIPQIPIEMFKFLIEEKRCDLNAVDSDKRSPLSHAFEKFTHACDPAVLFYLLSQDGVNVNRKGRDDYTLLHIACTHIYEFPIEVFKELLEEKHADINAKDCDLNTPLHHALIAFKPETDVDILTYLLEQDGVDFTAKDSENYTLLHQACLNVNSIPTKIFEYLIEIQNCDINAVDDEGITPIGCALLAYKDKGKDEDSLPLVYLIGKVPPRVTLKEKNQCHLLHSAAQNIKSVPLLAFMTLIESKGCILDVRDTQNQYTPLHYFFHELDLSIANQSSLLGYLSAQKGFNVNITGKDKRTPLHMACLNPHSNANLFMLLLNTHNAKLDPDCQGNTPLHLFLETVIKGNNDQLAAEVTAIFIKKKVRINLKNSSHETVLDIITPRSSTFPLTYKVLLDHGAKPAPR